MKPKVKLIITGILIGVIAFPTFALGSSFVSSLIQGKTIEEAVHILAEQVDALVGRVEVVETKQTEQEQTISDLQVIIDNQKQTIGSQQVLIEQTQLDISKNKACSDMYRYFKSDADAEHFYHEALKYQQFHGDNDPQALNWLKEYQLYLDAKDKCEK